MNSSLYTLGTAQLGMPYGVANKLGKPDIKQAFNLLDKAVALGIRSFDTATAYGNSEEILGDYFYQNQGIEHEIITKIKPLILDSQTPEDVAIQEVNESVQVSLERLKIESIPVLLFHRYDNLIWENCCLLDYLNKLSYIKKIGVSVYTPEQAVTAIGLDGISAIQLPTNLLDMRFIKARVFDLAEKRTSEYISGAFIYKA